MSEQNVPAGDCRPISEWHNLVLTDDAWFLGGTAAMSESQPKHITRCDGQRGIAKPAHAPNGTPRAAHEKIAADLGNLIGLSVPPAVLWKDPGTANTYCISSYAFRQPIAWNFAGNLVTPAFIKNCMSQIALAYVFHTWIGDTDRHGGNTLIDADCDEVQPRVAFIDHAFSMSHIWGSNPKMHPCVSGYLIGHCIEKQHIANSVKKVENAEPASVSDIVSRVPEDFLSPERGELVLKILQQRQGELRALLCP